jgi:small-conductance mechanosensitive channel
MPHSLRLTALTIALLALGVSPRAAQAQETARSEPFEPELEVPTAPVELDGSVVFSVRGVKAYPAETRAASIAARMREVAADPSVSVDSLSVEDSGAFAEIRAGEHLILRLFDADARLEGVTRQELAFAYSQLLGPAITEYRRARSPERLWPAAGRAAAATALLVALVTLVLRLTRRFDDALLRRLRRRIESLEERSFEVVRAERIQVLIRATLHTLRAAVILVATYAYLDYTLFLFPWTRFMAVRLGTWVVGPLRAIGTAFVASIPDLIFLAILAVVVRYGLRLLRLFFDGIASGRIRFEGFDAEWAQPTYKIVRLAAIAFALVVAYPYIPGSSSEAFKGVSLFMGVVFSLGSSSVIANVIAGYSMTYRRAFRLGDRVRIGGVVGDVTAVRLQVTHIRTPKNEEVVVPNSTILTSDVTNYSALARTQGLILHTSVGIGYEVPWRQVEALLLLAAERTAGLEREPAPFVLQTALGDFAVSYELNVYCRNPQAMPALYNELHRNIQDAFNEHGVQIMTPNYEADPPEPKLVPKEQWFAAPARRAPPATGVAGEKLPE